MKLNKKKENTKSKAKVKKKPSSEVNKNDFPIVGIGASAGGLEAFIKVFKKMPIDTGMAFVLVQHLDPTHASMSVDIISRETQLKIEEVKDKTPVKPNHIYIIPPNHNMEIEKGVLMLSARKTSPGQHMSIDFFFKSLARSEKSRAVGVILSGTANDGTAGLWAIKAEGGVTCAQDPTSAKYPSMPQSAIDAGIVDLTLQPEEMGKELARVFDHPYVTMDDFSENDEIKKEPYGANDSIIDPEDNLTQEALAELFAMLESQKRVDFAGYKQTTILRRIQRRMMVQKTKSLVEYVNFLRAHKEEVHALNNDILINVTEFFRDPEAFEALTHKVFPYLLENKSNENSIRIWVPGCSTGEEVYSIAISLLEFLRESGKQNPIQIFATDISGHAIQKARSGLYPESAVHGLSPERLARFFEKVETGYKINKTVRDICLFSRHDVTGDPPFAKLDLISCRNVMIYFGPILQKSIVPIFHYALKPSGCLWLGLAENIGEFSKLFSLEDKAHKIYFKSNVPTPLIQFSNKQFHSTSGDDGTSRPSLFAKTGSDLQRDADKIILSRFSPPGVVINSDFEILQFRGRTAPFLEPASGKPSMNLLKMARPELLASLRSTIQSVKVEKRSMERQGLHFDSDGKHLTVDLEVLPLYPKANGKDLIFLVLFKEKMEEGKEQKDAVSQGKKSRAPNEQRDKDRCISELMRELAEIKDYQQSLISQYEVSQEELTSANEELQSTNEEFQSTNEEIETAKEELQSTNEELITVNEELQMRNADLTTLSSDLNNLLASIELPILIVGGDYRVRRFSPKAKSSFNLLPSDIGRPIADIKPSFDLDLNHLISAVSETLTPKKVEIQNDFGKWLRLQIRPYKTIENKIDGAIISLTDIDELKKKEERSSEAFVRADKDNIAKDIFLATLSHELRTPLTSILMWSQLISQGKIDHEQAQKGAKVIENSAKAQNQLIDDLLDVSRITSGKLAIDLQPLDPAAIIRTAADSLRHTAESRSIQFQVDLPTCSELILADSIRLQQIIWNLLTNGIKFSPKQSTLRIELKYEQDGHQKFAKIQVSDSGKGISPDFLPYIFNRFSQGDAGSTRTQGGLGLGLSIVHSLVEMQNGTVTAENAKDGNGAIFTVSFPVIPSHSQSDRFHYGNVEAFLPQEKDENKELYSKLKELQILIVDDDENIREALSIYLKSFGAFVVAVDSAVAALETLKNLSPSVLISDIAMPGEDGYSLIRKIRASKNPLQREMPALALSACTTEEEVSHALASGFQEHLVKPVDVKELVHLILKIVR